MWSPVRAEKQSSLLERDSMPLSLAVIWRISSWCTLNELYFCNSCPKYDVTYPLKITKQTRKTFGSQLHCHGFSVLSPSEKPWKCDWVGSYTFTATEVCKYRLRVSGGRMWEGCFVSLNFPQWGQYLIMILTLSVHTHSYNLCDSSYFFFDWFLAKSKQWHVQGEGGSGERGWVTGQPAHHDLCLLCILAMVPPGQLRIWISCKAKITPTDKSRKYIHLKGIFSTYRHSH